MDFSTTVTADDIRAILPDSAISASPERIDALIAQAWTRLSLMATIPDDITSTRFRFARDMVIAAVCRVLIDPAPGLQSESEAGYSYSKASALDASANVWFPRDDLALLGAGAGKLGVIHMSRPRRDWR